MADNSNGSPIKPKGIYQMDGYAHPADSVATPQAAPVRDPRRRVDAAMTLADPGSTAYNSTGPQPFLPTTSPTPYTNGAPFGTVSSPAPYTNQAISADPAFTVSPSTGESYNNMGPFPPAPPPSYGPGDDSYSGAPIGEGPSFEWAGSDTFAPPPPPPAPWTDPTPTVVPTPMPTTAPAPSPSPPPGNDTSVDYYTWMKNYSDGLRQQSADANRQRMLTDPLYAQYMPGSGNPNNPANNPFNHDIETAARSYYGDSWDNNQFSDAWSHLITPDAWQAGKGSMAKQQAGEATATARSVAENDAQAAAMRAAQGNTRGFRFAMGMPMDAAHTPVGQTRPPEPLPVPVATPAPTPSPRDRWQAHRAQTIAARSILPGQPTYIAR